MRTKVILPELAYLLLVHINSLVIGTHGWIRLWGIRVEVWCYLVLFSAHTPLNDRVGLLHWMHRLTDRQLIKRLAAFVPWDQWKLGQVVLLIYMKVWTCELMIWTLLSGLYFDLLNLVSNFIEVLGKQCVKVLKLLLKVYRCALDLFKLFFEIFELPFKDFSELGRTLDDLSHLFYRLLLRFLDSIIQLFPCHKLLVWSRCLLGLWGRTLLFRMYSFNFFRNLS